MRRALPTLVPLFVTPQLMGAPGCGGPSTPGPILEIQSPADGTFTTGASVVVTGYARRGNGPISFLTVNGV